MAMEQYFLCWDNFHKNISSGMLSLLETEDLVDVTLAIEGQHLKAHKMILSVCSSYFRSLFNSNPCNHPIIFMKDVSYSIMCDLLTFMYKGEVQINQECFDTFIKTAEALQINGLTGDNKRNEKLGGTANKLIKVTSRENAILPNLQSIVKIEEEIESIKMEPFETIDFNQSDSQIDWFMNENGDNDYATNEDEPKAGPSLADLNVGCNQGKILESKKRKAISLETKLNIIRRVENGEKKIAVANSLGLAKSTVSTILTQSEKIKQSIQNCKDLKSNRLRRPIFEKMENTLIVEISRNNDSLSPAAIQEKALFLFDQLKSKETGETAETFIASHRWYETFMRRVKIYKAKSNGAVTKGKSEDPTT